MYMYALEQTILNCSFVYTLFFKQYYRNVLHRYDVEQVKGRKISYTRLNI